MIVLSMTKFWLVLAHMYYCFGSKDDKLTDLAPRKTSPSLTVMYIRVDDYDAVAVCGGAILSVFSVLTAAHCFKHEGFKGPQLEKLFFLGGINKEFYANAVFIYRPIPARDLTADLSSLGSQQFQFRYIQSISYPDHYDYPHHDIAVVLLRKPWIFNQHLEKVAIASDFRTELKGCRINRFDLTDYKNKRWDILPKLFFDEDLDDEEQYKRSIRETKITKKQKIKRNEKTTLQSPKIKLSFKIILKRNSSSSISKAKTNYNSLRKRQKRYKRGVRTSTSYEGINSNSTVMREKKQNMFVIENKLFTSQRNDKDENIKILQKFLENFTITEPAITEGNILEKYNVEFSNRSKDYLEEKTYGESESIDQPLLKNGPPISAESVLQFIDEKFKETWNSNNLDFNKSLNHLIYTSTTTTKLQERNLSYFNSEYITIPFITTWKFKDLTGSTDSTGTTVTNYYSSQYITIPFTTTWKFKDLTGSTGSIKTKFTNYNTDHGNIHKYLSLKDITYSDIKPFTSNTSSKVLETLDQTLNEILERLATLDLLRMKTHEKLRPELVNKLVNKFKSLSHLNNFSITKTTPKHTTDTGTISSSNPTTATITNSIKEMSPILWTIPEFTSQGMESDGIDGIQVDQKYISETSPPPYKLSEFVGTQRKLVDILGRAKAVNNKTDCVEAREFPSRLWFKYGYYREKYSRRFLSSMRAHDDTYEVSLGGLDDLDGGMPLYCDDVNGENKVYGISINYTTTRDYYTKVATYYHWIQKNLKH